MKSILFTFSFCYLFVYQQLFAINPIRDYVMTPEVFKMEYVDTTVVTSDDAELHVWVMKTKAAEKKNTTFLIAGSDAGNMGYSLPYVFRLLENGYDVVTFDYRGFGSSSDFEFNSNNVYHDEYITDFQTVVNWAKVYLEPKQLGVLAFSMGTLVSTAAYEETPYDFLVGEGFVVDAQKIAARVKETKDKTLVVPESAVEIEKRLKKIDIPILILASTKDQVTTLADSESLMAGQMNRNLVTYDGDHLQGAATMGIVKYAKVIDEFVIYL
ncbi:MAG: alpha/beta fold hydrolase [Bacteroidota bacterium]